MSSIQTRKIVLESTANNTIEYVDGNSYIFTAGGASVLAINSSSVTINSSSATFKANGSVGTSGQFLTSNGTTSYWSNIATQTYTWSNTHTFQNAITFSTNVSIGGVTNANTSGIFTTATVNSPAYTVGSAFIANTSGVYHTGTVNSAVLSIGSSVTANSTRFTIATGVGFSANGTVGTNGQILLSNGVSPYWASLATGGLTPNAISANATAVKSNYYVATAALTLTLPASPQVGDVVGFQNYSNTKTCVIARNSANIMGLAQNLTIDTLNAPLQLMYIDATKGWVFY